MHCRRSDISIAVTLGAFALAAAYFLFGQIDPQIYYGQGEAGEDVWFDADSFTAYSNLTDRQSNHYRTDLHPLHSILTYPIVTFIHLAGFSHYEAVRLFVSITAVAWLIVFYIILRSTGLRPIDGFVFSGVLASSASAIFMAPLAELFLLSSITLLLPFLVLAQNRGSSVPIQIAVSAATLSLTVTNWMSGILATVLCHRLKSAVVISLCALGVVIALWLLQKLWFPSALLFLPDPTGRLYEPSFSSYRSRMWLPPLTLADVANRATVFISHVMVMPGVQLTMHREHADWDWPSISIMDSPLGSGGPFAWIATILWLALLTIGLWALVTCLKQKNRPQLCIALGLTLIGQFVLHVKFGVETFLYSLHWAPLIVMMTALAALTPMRNFAVGLASLLVLFGGLNNFLLFRAVTPLIVEHKAAWIAMAGKRISYDFPTGILSLNRPYSGRGGEGL